MTSLKKTLSTSLFGTSTPIADFPGIGASIRTELTARLRAKLSDKLWILLTFIPSSIDSSYLVTEGPLLIWITSVFMLKLFNVFTKVIEFLVNSISVFWSFIFVFLFKNSNLGNWYIIFLFSSSNWSSLKILSLSGFMIIGLEKLLLLLE